jgi:type VI secretion system secreted protein Hcp
MAVNHWTMKIQDKYKIDGQSTSHDKEIEIFGAAFDVARTWKMGSNNQNMPEGSGAISPIVVAKEVDKSSPKMYYACLSGQHLGEVVITGWTSIKDKDEPELQYKLTDTGLSSVSTGKGSGGIDTDTLTLSFAKIDWTFKQFDATGKAVDTVPASWDLAKVSGKAA